MPEQTKNRETSLSYTKEENKAYAERVIALADKPKLELLLKRVENPERYRDRFLTFDTVCSLFPNVKNVTLLPFGTIRISFKSLLDKVAASTKSVASLGASATLEELNPFEYRFELKKVPRQVDQKRLEKHLKTAIPDFKKMKWTGSPKAERANLVISTTKKTAFLEAMRKGKIKVGPFTFEVTKPSSKAIICWRCGHKGHAKVICPEPEPMKEEMTQTGEKNLAPDKGVGGRQQENDVIVVKKEGPSRRGRKSLKIKRGKNRGKKKRE